MAKNYWLAKSEPESYSWQKFLADGKTAWTGVRNFQARNNMIAMHAGDRGFFYHSSTKPPGIVGICEVVREAYPDFTQFERGHEYEDPTSRPERPKWWMVDVGFVRKFQALITLEALRAMPALEGMLLLRRGQRLSVQPVTSAQWSAIVETADALERSDKSSNISYTA